jgi:hypothetical protein
MTQTNPPPSPLDITVSNETHVMDSTTVSLTGKELIKLICICIPRDSFAGLIKEYLSCPCAYNLAPRHEKAIWSSVVSLKSRPLYHEEKTPDAHQIRGWLSPRTVLDNVDSMTILTEIGFELPLLRHSSLSQSLYQTIKMCRM